MNRKALENEVGKLMDSQYDELQGLNRSVINITANYGSGKVAGVELSEEFKNEDPLFQADLLSDAIEQLKAIYEEKINEWYLTSSTLLAQNGCKSFNN